MAVTRREVTALHGFRRRTRLHDGNGSAQGDLLSGTRAKAIALLLGLQLRLITPFALWGSGLLAQTPGVDSLFPARPVGYVNDFAGLMEPADTAALESLLLRLKAATGAELVVVTLPSIGDRDEAEVALAIGRRWKIGPTGEIGDPRQNAGALLLVVPRQNHQVGTGHVRIETGRGIEGIVTDAAAGRIRDQVMGPDLKQEAYGAAIQKGTRALVSLIAQGFGVSDTALTAYQLPAGSGGAEPTIGNLLPFIFLVLFILMMSGAFGGRRRRRSGIYWGGPWIGGGWGSGGGFGGGGGGFGGFGGGGGFSGGGAGGRF
jgi:uncharacterized protein